MGTELSHLINLEPIRTPFAHSCFFLPACFLYREPLLANKSEIVLLLSRLSITERRVYSDTCRFDANHQRISVASQVDTTR